MEKQTLIGGSLAVILLNGCQKPPEPPTFEIAERYSVTARVIATKRYSSQNDYWAPVDAILAWGPLLDPQTTKTITFSQSGRWYYWYPPPDVDRQMVAQHTANTHLVADNEPTRDLILSLKPGKSYFLEGALVNVNIAANRTMRSSTSRTDSGGGACEVFLVKKATLVR